MNKLFQLDVLTLPDCKTLPDYGEYMDEDGVLIEIAQSKIYRRYIYTTPQIRVNKFVEARKIISILDLIENEFNLKSYFEKGQ